MHLNMHLKQWTFALVASLCIVGCDKKPKANPEESLSFGNECNDQTAQQITEWLQAWKAWHEDGAQLSRSDAQYVVREGARLTDSSIMVNLSADRILVDQAAVSGFDDLQNLRRALGAEVEVARSRRAKLGNDNVPIALAIEFDVPAETVVRLLPVLAPYEPTLAFQAPKIASEYRVPESVRAEHAQLYEGQAKIRAEVPESERHECTPIYAVGEKLERATPKDRWSIVAADLGPAWVECGCPEEFDIERALVGYTSPYVRRPLAAAGPTLVEGGHTVRIESNSTWADVAKRLPTSGRAWLELVP